MSNLIVDGLKNFIDEDETLAEFDLDEMPDVDGEQKVKLHTGGKTIEVEVESDEHEEAERLEDSALTDSLYTVIACTDDFAYGSNRAVIVEAKSEGDAVAKYRKRLEANGMKVNSINARPTYQSDIDKGITRLKLDSLRDFKVKDSKSGRTFVVNAKDSKEAVNKVRKLI